MTRRTRPEIPLASVAEMHYKHPMARVSLLPPSIVAGITAGLLLVGCSHHPQYLATPGSISAMKEKSAASNAKAKSKEKVVPIIAVVSHDAAGLPAYVEIQRSSGSPEVDQQAVQWVLDTLRFPPGKLDTESVTIDPKSLPKPKASPK